MNAFVAFLILCALVLFHELGHFILARICGVKVEVFSIGFGKKLLSLHFRGTQYALSLIPLGGYVKLKGQDAQEDSHNASKIHHDSDSYLAKTPLQRIAILLAGSMFNILLALILYMIVGLIGKPTLLPVIGEVREDFPAYIAGVQSGDRILAINTQEIKSWSELDSLIAQSIGEIELVLERAGQRHFIKLTPVSAESTNIFGERESRKVIGIISKNEVGKIAYGIWESVGYAFNETLKTGKLLILGIVKLVSGAIPMSEVGGVVSIVSVIGTASQDSLTTLLYLTAFISINLGILNLLPIPVLDGGHIVLNLYELCRGKAPQANVVHYLTIIGFGVLISLMVLGLYNDILRLF